MFRNLGRASRKRGRARRGPFLAIRMLPLATATVVFLGAFVVDPAAVVRLVGLGLTGGLGAALQIAMLVGLFALLAATLWALRAVPSRSVARRRKPVDNRGRRNGKPQAARKRRSNR